MILDEENLKDPYCNFCMKAADNGKNGVLVVSPLLEEYVRRNYPGFKINSDIWNGGRVVMEPSRSAQSARHSYRMMRSEVI